MIVNVVCARRGEPWLFDDLLEHFAARAAPRCPACLGADIEHTLKGHLVGRGAPNSASCPCGWRGGLETDCVAVRTSHEPMSQADSWIFIRANEAATSPDLSRSVVQIHDVWGLDDDENPYAPGAEREAVRHCGGLVLTQPIHREILFNCGVDLAGKALLEQPIGALRCFTPRTEADRSDVFTVGWAGRPSRWRGIDWKRLDDVVEALIALGPPLRVMLIGEGLESHSARLWDAGIETDFYIAGALARLEGADCHRRRAELFREMDAFVSFSRAPADAVGVFEALASGVPVVKSPGGWCDSLGCWIAEDVSQMVSALRSLRLDRAGWQGSAPWRTEDWIAENLRLAVGLPR